MSRVLACHGGLGLDWSVTSNGAWLWACIFVLLTENSALYTWHATTLHSALLLRLSLCLHSWYAVPFTTVVALAFFFGIALSLYYLIQDRLSQRP